VTTVSTKAAPITSQASQPQNGASAIVASIGYGRNISRAIDCSRVLSLPPAAAAITSYRSIATRIQVMPHSRTRMSTVIHHGSSPSTERQMKAAPVSALSAIGSQILPKSLISP
jgi:hypothetical protein